MAKKQDYEKSECPYTGCYDCVCRCGTKCGGWKIGNFPPDPCPYYKPVNKNAILDIITRLMNDCEACVKNRVNGGNCSAHKCKRWAAIDALNEMYERFKARPLK